MESIPRITSLFDTRNIISLLFYSALCRIVIKSVLSLRKATPKVNSIKRIGRTIQKRKHQAQSSKLFDDASISQSNQLLDSESSCLVCKQGMKHRHANTFQSNIGTFTAASQWLPGASSNKKQVISLSPLKKYIRNNNIYLNNINNLNNNNNNNNELVKDLNNNNNSVCVIDSSPLPVTSFAPVYQATSKHVAARFDNQMQSVKSKVSSKLASVATYIKSAEKCSKHAKLSSAAATLISIAIIVLPFLVRSILHSN